MRKAFFDRTASVLLLLPAIIFSATSTINFSTTHQVIDGFGGSSAWCAAYNATVADALFGNAANQVGFTILRLRIDPNNNWATEKTNATMAKARGATVFATPWSPPPAYKTVNNVVGGAINTAHFADFAAWMKSFWTYCGSANVDIMSLENEPDYSPNYECCSWTAQNFDDFCKTYAPQIGKPIMMPESMNYNYAVSNTALNDATAAANITYIGGHLYGGIPGTAYTLALNLGKHVWETEHYISNDGATQCMQLASEIMACLNNLNMSAYCWWWMTYNTGDGLWTGSAPNHRAWVIGQFSKWVRPGFVRVDATYAPQAGVNVVAFKGTNYVIVAENSNTTSQSVTFTCSNATIPSVNKYTSSQTKNGASDGLITATTNSFTTTLDAQSVTTFVSTNTVSIMEPYRVVGKPFGIATTNAAAHFMYLINGKRFSLKGMNEQGIQAPGIFIIPGNTQVGDGAVKSLHVSKK